MLWPSLPFPICLKYESAQLKSCEMCKVLGILGMTLAPLVSFVPNMSVKSTFNEQSKDKSELPIPRDTRKIGFFI